MSHIVYRNIIPFDFRGLQIRELAPKELKSVSVAEIQVPPGARHETARSTKCDKLYIGVEGTVLFRVENRASRLEPGDLLLIRKNEWFDYGNDGDKTAKVILIHVPPFDLECEEFRESADPRKD